MARFTRNRGSRVSHKFSTSNKQFSGGVSSGRRDTNNRVHAGLGSQVGVTPGGNGQDMMPFCAANPGQPDCIAFGTRYYGMGYRRGGRVKPRRSRMPRRRR